MIAEVPETDVKETKSTETDNFKKINPERDMSVSELNDSVESEFNAVANEETNKSEYFDDNGVKYREGNELLPNNEFEINSYTYKTDGEGRVISAEGKLQVKNHEGRFDMDSRSALDKGDMRETDDRGHLIADRFNGSGGIENLVPMDSDLNQHGDYNKLEGTLSDAVRDGADVRLKVEPIYEAESTRPTEFRITFSIDGDKEMVIFKNESGRES